MRRLAMTTVITMAMAACSDDGASGATEGQSTTSTTDDTVTTLPFTSAMPDGDDDGVEETAADPDTRGTTEGSDDTGTGDATATGTSTGDDDTESTGDVAPVTVEWCRLQSPAAVSIDAGDSFTVYGRYYIETVTDQSTQNDPHPLVVAELGYGADGSDPAVDPWTWITGTPNPGWDGTDWGEPDNDETMGEITIDRAGTYDYAVRLSGDGGTTWVYCDLDDLLNGGYTPDQAGDATVL